MSNNLIDSKATHKFSYGLFVLTANYKKQSGCIINTAIQLTSDPLKISIAVNKNNYTLEMIKQTKEFNVSVISENASFDLFKRFGFQSGKDVDKFKDFACNKSSNGINFIEQGTNAYFSAQVESMLDVGTHTLIVAKVTESKVLNDTPSATYAYYLNNVKPKPQTTASGDIYYCPLCGYEYDESKEKVPFKDLPSDWTCPLCGSPKSVFVKKEKPKIYVCSICGYEYDESKEKVPFKDLPSDWTCPLCKHPKSDFELKK